MHVFFMVADSDGFVSIWVAGSELGVEITLYRAFAGPGPNKKGGRGVGIVDEVAVLHPNITTAKKELASSYTFTPLR